MKNITFARSVHAGLAFIVLLFILGFHYLGGASKETFLTWIPWSSNGMTNLFIFIIYIIV
ncbi:hypothetical protein R83H12_02414 [Fibrobacteria bacterium R8-3-H12]